MLCCIYLVYVFKKKKDSFFFVGYLPKGHYHQPTWSYINFQYCKDWKAWTIFCYINNTLTMPCPLCPCFITVARKSNKAYKCLNHDISNMCYTFYLNLKFISSMFWCWNYVVHSTFHKNEKIILTYTLRTHFSFHNYFIWCSNCNYIFNYIILRPVNLYTHLLYEYNLNYSHITRVMLLCSNRENDFQLNILFSIHLVWLIKDSVFLLVSLIE